MRSSHEPQNSSKLSKILISRMRRVFLKEGNRKAAKKEAAETPEEQKVRLNAYPHRSRLKVEVTAIGEEVCYGIHGEKPASL